MNYKIITIFLVISILTGCKFIEDLKNVQFVTPKPPTILLENNSTNQTNQTINETKTPTKLEINESYPNIFVFSSSSILIVDKGKSYVIDSPKANPQIVKLIKEFDIDELEFVVSTIDKEEHNGGIQYIVVVSPPKIIYDNGIENEYKDNYISRLDRYNQYWNRTPTIYTSLIEDKDIGDFKFFVPYSRGLSTTKEENSIVVYYKGQFLYMSDCYGGCEKKIPPVTTTFFVLANNGNCPTNSFDFILSTGAKYVLWKELCPEVNEETGLTLKEELDMIGINQIKIEEVVQIILKDE